MNYKDGKTNVFNDNNAQEVDNAIFGELDIIPSSGRRVAKPADVLAIWPDPRQPRRAIPAVVREGFDGDPLKLGDLLGRWYLQVKGMVQNMPKMQDLLLGVAEWPADDDERSVVHGLGALVNLAAGIHRDGLINPITIYDDGERLRCLTGERRLLAHHLLREYVDKDKYQHILAVKTDYSVAQQVAENTQRRDLNAIGMARCYALMVMDLWREEGKQFGSYERMTAGGTRSDLYFYAQAAELRVPYGKGKDLQTALNVGDSSVQRYRMLLTLPAEVWQEADEGEWSLRECLDWFEARKPVRTPRTLTPPPTPPRRQGGEKEPHPQNGEGGMEEREEYQLNSNRKHPRVGTFPSDDAPEMAETDDSGGESVSKDKQTAFATPPKQDGEWLCGPQYIEARRVFALIFGMNLGEEIGTRARFFNWLTAEQLSLELDLLGVDAFTVNTQQFVDEVEAQLTVLWEGFVEYMDMVMRQARDQGS